MKKGKSGVTLIALVLTIIILIMLAVIVLRVGLGKNGLIEKSQNLKNKSMIAEDKDYIITSINGLRLYKRINRDNSAINSQELENKLKLNPKYSDSQVVENGDEFNIKLKYHNYVLDRYTYSFKEEKPLPKVGDTIIYDPTRGVTDQSLLKYTAKKEQTGHDKDQTITATSNHNEWVVISISGGQIKMMSKEPIDGIEGGKDQGENTQGFALKGGKGYLYAEEELHKMCAVFGHGKGASKISTKYTIGNPYIGEEEQRTLSGSGARSLTKEDIVKIMKGDDAKDFTEEEKKSFNSRYKTSVRREVYYPTKVSTKESRESNNKKKFIEDFYLISKYKYTNYENAETKTARDALVNSIFKDKVYWYSSRYVRTNSSYARFCVGGVNSSNVSAAHLFGGNTGSVGVSSWGQGLRPVVFLDSSVQLEKSNSESDTWKIK